MLESDAYARIRKMILDGDLAAGTVISEAKLCEELNMSRTPVRVAINRLDIEGFITQSKGRFSTVRLITSSDICNFFQIALIVEEHAMRTLHKNPQLFDVARARELLSLQSEAVSAGNSYAATKHDHSFHMLINDVIDNAELHMQMENIWDKTLLALNPRIRRATKTVGADSIAEHSQIIDSIAARAPLSELLDSVRLHNNNARNRMLLQ